MDGSQAYTLTFKNRASYI